MRNWPSTKVAANSTARARNAGESHVCGLSHPEYRLRVGDDVRVFYDVADGVVQILAIVPKSNADAWLTKHGESDETDSTV